MALIWADGFDHYGSGAEMQKVYGDYGSNNFYNGAGARTGLGYVEHYNEGGSFSKLIANPLPAIGFGIGFRPNNFPGNLSHSLCLIDTAGNYSRISWTSGLGFAFHFNGTLIATSAGNLVTVANWQHIEFYCNKGNGTTTGYMEARLNGNVILTASGLALGATSYNKWISLNYGGGSGSWSLQLDDFIMWDTTGTVNNSFLGDRRCLTSFPTSNGATQNWGFSGGATAWQSINSVGPSAVNYIEGINSGDASEFQKNALTLLATGVAGIRVVASALKTDAGAASFRLGMKSVATAVMGSSITPGTTSQYYDSILELDPNGNIPWTKASVEAALVRIAKD